MTPSRFVLVGLPGSGKSTVGRLAARATSGAFVEEEPDGFDFVSLAFEAPQRYAALGQIEFLLAKAREELSEDEGAVWQEVDTRYCHAVWSSALRGAGRLDAVELRLIDRMAALLDAVCPRPRAMISLELEWGELQRRVSERGREYEASGGRLDPGFAGVLEALYGEHLAFVESGADGVPLHRVDASSPVQDVVRDVLAHAGV